MRPGKPRISIGMPVYNGAKFLREALESLVAQSFDDFELVISDNASSDETQEICREYSARDKRIRYSRNEANIGLYGNCNRTFRLCSGEYFKLAASDDVCHRDLVARCVEVLDHNPAAVLAYPKTIFINADGQEIPYSDPGWDLRSESGRERMGYVIRSGHRVNVFFGLMRTHALAKTRLFPTYSSGDYRLLGELSLLGKFIEVPEQLFYRRIHQEASSQSTSSDSQAKYFKGTPGPSLLPLWHLCFDHSVSIVRSELSLGQKLALIGSVTNRMIFSTGQLLQELAIAVNAYAKLVSRAAN